MSMNDIEKSKHEFRQSSIWKKFRKFKFSESSKDFVTHKKLKANYRLHHLDLNPEHYKDLSDPSHFENLNNETHKMVHYLYPLYRKDSEVLDRLKDLFDRMMEINS